jgi:hypothetical protein
MRAAPNDIGLTNIGPSDIDPGGIAFPGDIGPD